MKEIRVFVSNCAECLYSHLRVVPTLEKLLYCKFIEVRGTIDGKIEHFHWHRLVDNIITDFEIPEWCPLPEEE